MRDARLSLLPTAQFKRAQSDLRAACRKNPYDNVLPNKNITSKPPSKLATVSSMDVKLAAVLYQQGYKQTSVISKVK